MKNANKFYAIRNGAITNNVIVDDVNSNFVAQIHSLYAHPGLGSNELAFLLNRREESTCCRQIIDGYV